MEPLHERLTRTAAQQLKPGDQGIGLINLGGEAFPVPVTVQRIEPDGAVVEDSYGKRFKTPSLLAVGENIDTIIQTHEENQDKEHDAERRKRYKQKHQTT